MSLNDIELPRTLVAELYKDSLVIGASVARPGPMPKLVSQLEAAGQISHTTHTGHTASVAPPQTTDYKFLGNNHKKITVLVEAPGTTFLPDDQLAFLTKMLEACKMNIGDVAIVNHAAAPINIGALKRQLSPSFLLLFGPEPGDIQLPLHFPVFKIQAYDQCTYLSAPSLARLVQPGEESKLLKSKLWVSLRALFEI